MSEIERLERLTGSDPGSPAFPALAEAHRRSGDPGEAERIARAGLRLAPGHVAGRVSLGLALWDQGRVEAARLEFERCLDGSPDHPLAIPRASAPDAAAPQPFGPSPPPVPVGSLDVEEAFSEHELEQAFASARAQPVRPLGVDEVAAWALEESGAERDVDLSGSPDSPFTTETMASLLAQQGGEAQAAAIRRRLAERELPEAQRDAGGTDPHTRVVSNLERWLDNLRRGAA